MSELRNLWLRLSQIYYTGIYDRRSEGTNRQTEVNGKPEGFRMKNKNPIVEVITKYKYRNESNKAKRAKIN